jgi:glycosyltransferase involved in cell wall biosynthesis
MRPDDPELSFVIPVYNGASSIGRVVDEIHLNFPSVDWEIILVNDGSVDESERVCRFLVERGQGRVHYLHLAKNFSEHNAVLAGLNASRGRYVAVLDDDGQNPPAEIVRMYEAILQGAHDVVYGYYREKQHHWLRNWGSRFNDKMANIMLDKPSELYLSSFKIMNRFVVDQITRYRGAFPYIDGLIFRCTRNIAQIPVQHVLRATGKSGYTLKKLLALWLNMFLNFSIKPLRCSVFLGLGTSLCSIPLIFLIVIDKILNPEVTLGVPTILVGMTLFAGIQLLIIGLVGEYLGRLYLDQTGTPQFVVRYSYHKAEITPPQRRERWLSPSREEEHIRLYQEETVTRN